MKPITILLLLLTSTMGFPLQPPMKDFFITSEVGYRTDPMGGGDVALHRGLDMVGYYHCPVLAAGDGVVVEHWLPPGTTRGGKTYKGHPVFGGMIIIDHGDGTFTLYGHLSSTFIHEGQVVKAGDVIGRQGSTGQATGEHLHFEVIVTPTLFFDLPPAPLPNSPAVGRIP